MTNLSVRDCALAWVQAYNSRNLDALMLCYDEHAVNVQHPWGKAVHGIAAIRSTYERTFSCFPDISLSVDACITDDAKAAIQWEFSGTMQGEFAGHPPTGRKFQLRGCEILRFFAGRVVEQTGYWDRATMFRQLGLPGG
ncbi:ester cyclase [Piscinibacter sp. HJYY11]|uniref:ester cyclase n=1 Tax=Piscinibacter sp. HJYY11 TaxID=2801333 RepID=UPI00191D0DAA|nr:ester cyclase [Piscinibacter sp. HJYY11]MBL0727157.1 ester cyclase [Piscinibacter sp. HJYY11]